MSLWSRMRPPLWARWALSLLVAAAAVVALVVHVNRHNNNALGHVSPAAQERANREAEVVVGADQAPHVVRLGAGVAPRAAFRAAIRAEMRRLVSGGTVGGPLQRVGCRQSGTRAGKFAFACTAEAANVNYPFVGVVSRGARRLVYCKRDIPPVPSENIPVSARCRLRAR